ncbi:hypothetical protein [Legionella pneumophila]
MKRLIALIFLLSISQTTAAKLLFNVIATGVPDNINIIPSTAFSIFNA